MHLTRRTNTGYRALTPGPSPAGAGEGRRRSAAEGGSGTGQRPAAARTVGALGVACAVAALAVLAQADAQTPPQPDFFWPYGVIQAGGANVDPVAQPLIAFVRGTSCGAATTKLALAGADVPAGDVGKTVFVVDVLADGNGAGQRPGCGRIGDPVTLWLPLIGRMGTQQPAFKQGEMRVDVDVAVALSQRRWLPIVSSDGPQR